MKRIFPDFAYGPEPRAGCWWDETCDIPREPAAAGDIHCDVVVVGAGFTGVSAALHLAQAGASVVVLEAQRIGWGASGRNGGFCCLGGGIASDVHLDRRFGQQGRLDWRGAERDAVDLVAQLLETLALDVDHHSEGETRLAHRARDARGFAQEAVAMEENYGVAPHILARNELPGAGIGGTFHGALTTPIGFGLNPRKYLAGLVAAAKLAGVVFHEMSPVNEINSRAVKTPQAALRAERVILATNGYSSEDVPAWMTARYMPAQSTVLVTRPLSQAELEAQGWTTSQMCYDTRTLLHYFRLMPDSRFLFGMRGGLLSSPRAEARARTAVLQDFRSMFPGWARVSVTHTWSGLVCLARNQLPYIGAVPGLVGVIAGFAYHGNGVAMGTYAGAKLAQLVLNDGKADLPEAMRAVPSKFPFGRARRVLMPPLYAAFAVGDRLP